MKGSAFLPVVLIACLALYGGAAYTVLRPGASLPSLTAESRAAGILLADRIETGDSVTYTTDPKMERESREEDREEKQKEKNSWKMLQNMYLPARRAKQPSSSGSSGSTGSTGSSGQSTTPSQ